MVNVNGSSFLVRTFCATFNHESYITDALQGFVMQETSFPVVYTIVDDASTDKTAEVLRRFVNEHFDVGSDTRGYDKDTDYGHITFAQHKTNKNCYFAVIYLKENHYSQKKSKAPYLTEWIDTKYIALCEGDDYWTDPLKLQKQVDFLEEHEEYSMCCTAFSHTFDGHEESKQIVRYDLDEITVDELLKERWIGTLTILYRSELMSDYAPPFPNLPFGDLPMWFHLALKGRVKYMKDITANYRSLPSSACHSTDLQKQFTFGLDAMRVREHYAMLDDKIDVVRPVLSKNSHYYLEQCYKNRWLDFPMDSLWHFVKEYGHPSGYDKLKYWGMKSEINYAIASALLKIKGKK